MFGVAEGTATTLFESTCFVLACREIAEEQLVGRR